MKIHYKKILYIISVSLFFILLFSFTNKKSLKENMYFQPHIKADALYPEISARSAIVLYTEDATSTILFSKDVEQSMPIASISKLFTIYTVASIVGIENIEREYLEPALIYSANESTKKIAQMIDPFAVNKINEKIFEIGLSKTFIYNPTGLDDLGYNFSTALDLAYFGYFLNQTPEGKEMFKISKEKYYKGIEATNKSLSDTRIPFDIIGGKTGETDLAKQTLLLLTKSPNRNGNLVFVVLGSDDRVEDMAILTNWINQNTIWTNDTQKINEKN